MNRFNHMLSPRHFILSLAVCAVFGFSSCEEEVGCTDRRADNYNPDAVRDDGTCINARDKFLGVYNVLQICWPDTLLPQPRYVTVAEDNIRLEEKDDIKLLNFGSDSIIVRALISKNELTIPRQDLSVRGIPMTFRGQGHIDDEGYLTIRYSTWLPNGDLILDNCVVFMTPLQ